MHTRERPYLCSHKTCNKRFSDRGELLQHEKSHTKEHTHQRSDKSFKETFAKPLELHGPYREEHGMTTNPVEMLRPIRLRLSQPKRQNPGSLEDSPRKRTLLRLSMGKTSDPKQAPEICSEPKASAKGPANCVERSKLHQESHLSSSRFSTISTSEAGTEYQISSHSFNFTSQAMPRIPIPNVNPQALAVPQSRVAEKTLDEPCTNKQSSWDGTSVYTRVCGVYSVETASPEKVKNNSGRFHCPRCDSQYKRVRGVRKHFVGCITRYGNPDSLRWTDHPSLQNIVEYYARNGYGGRQYDLLLEAADVEKVCCRIPADGMFRCLIPKPLTFIGEESTGNVKATNESTRQDALLQKKIVQPIFRRRDALRRTKYNPETIARDVLLATGSHPSMDPLNAHLDILQKNFRNVKPESNMSTFRWDLVDPMHNSKQSYRNEIKAEPRREDEHEHESQQRGEDEVEPEQSTPHVVEARKDAVRLQFNNDQWHYGFPFSLPSRTSMKIDVLDTEISFTVTLPGEAHFGPMSTLFSNVFDRDPSAKLMSNNEDLWAAIFTMLKHRHHGPDFMIRTAIGRQTGNILGWIACHDVDTLQAMSGDPLAYLDWTTAAHLLPPQITRFTSTKEGLKVKTDRSDQRKVGQGLASTIQARATEAQTYLVPFRRLVINALVVHPSHQGRGVASALLQSITEMVDMDQRPIWIQAPEDPAVAQGLLKAGLFRRAGFFCAGELNLDLDRFASQEQEHDNKNNVRFGSYKWNYMLRWPHPVSSRNRDGRVGFKSRSSMKRGPDL